MMAVEIDKFVLGRIQKNSAEDPKRDVGFMPTQLVQVSLPYRQQSGRVFERTSGDYSLNVVDTMGVGLPYGVIPRMFLIWLSSEVYRRKDRVINLGKSFRTFVASMGYFNLGGSETKRIKDQMKRLVSSAMSFKYSKDGEWISVGFFIVDRAEFDDSNAQKEIPFKGHFIVSETFYKECLRGVVPCDMNAIRLLRHSPLAIDIYLWLTYKNFVLKQPVTISWKALKNQFGSSSTPTWKFKQTFCKQLEAVKAVYSNALVQESRKGLMVVPTTPHIAPRKDS